MLQQLSSGAVERLINSRIVRRRVVPTPSTTYCTCLCRYAVLGGTSWFLKARCLSVKELLPPAAYCNKSAVFAHVDTVAGYWIECSNSASFLSNLFRLESVFAWWSQLYTHVWLDVGRTCQSSTKRLWACWGSSRRSFWMRSSFSGRGGSSWLASGVHMREGWMCSSPGTFILSALSWTGRRQMLVCSFYLSPVSPVCTLPEVWEAGWPNLAEPAADSPMWAPDAAASFTWPHGRAAEQTECWHYWHHLCPGHQVGWTFCLTEIHNNPAVFSLTRAVSLVPWNTKINYGFKTN